MADTADLRSEGRRSTHPGTVFKRKQRLERINAGVCCMCGKTEVLNRKVCYACSLEQSEKTKLAGFRSWLRDHGVEDPQHAVDELTKLTGGSWMSSPLHGLFTSLLDARYKVKRS